MREELDIQRRQLQFAVDRTKKFKRLLFLFLIVDFLILIRIVLSISWEDFLEHPHYFQFWFAVLTFALCLSAYFIGWLWHHQREREQWIKLVDKEKREQIKKRNKAQGLFVGEED